MIKKEVFIGFLVGLIANTLGLLLAIQFFGNGDSFENSIKSAFAQGFFGKILSIGAILNLAAFFIFIKKKQDYRARGVLLATVIMAICTFVIKFI